MRSFLFSALLGVVFPEHRLVIAIESHSFAIAKQARLYVSCEQVVAFYFLLMTKLPNEPARRGSVEDQKRQKRGKGSK